MGMHEQAERSIARALNGADAGLRTVLLDLRAKNSAARAQATAATAPQDPAEREAARLAAVRAKTNFVRVLPYDVLVIIAKMGAAEDPDFALRMGGVCCEWRTAALSYAPLWARLRVTRRRPAKKIGLFAERSGGRIRELVFGPVTSSVERKDIARAIEPYLDYVERFELPADDFGYYRLRWERRFPRLRFLNVTVRDSSIKAITSPITAFNTLEGTSLREAEINGIDLRLAPEPEYPSAHLFSKPCQVANLRKLTFTALIDPGVNILDLVECTPELCELNLGYTSLPMPISAIERDAVCLSKLTKLEIRGNSHMEHNIPPQLELPSLEHLSVYEFNPMGGCAPLRTLESAGVSWNKLVSLEFGRYTPVNQAELLERLPDLTALQFLSLPFNTSIDNALLEALVVEDGRPALLPALSALSIAHNDNISAGPIRRMVLSRNAPHKVAKAMAPPVAPQRRSAFAPVRRPRAEPIAAATTPTPSAPGPVVVPIRWLCFDFCNNPHMDSRVLDKLPGVGFLSLQAGGKMNVDRMRGRGAYAWDHAFWDNVGKRKGMISERVVLTCS
jgi:hypothetical protein